MKPVMCADRLCGGDYCCDYAGSNACNGLGGPRSCNQGEWKIYIYVYIMLRMLFRN